MPQALDLPQAGKQARKGASGIQEKKMKQKFTVLVAAFALLSLSAIAQTTAPATTGKVSGHAQSTTGVPMADGIVSFYKDATSKKADFTAKTDANGDYTIDIAPGAYTVVLRNTDTPADKQIDSVTNFKVVAGASQHANFDLTRPEYIKTLPPEMQKQIAEVGAKNKTAMAENALIKNLNGDLTSARASTKAKDFASSEALMLKDTGLLKSSTIRQDQAALLWIELGAAQNGLKKYDDAVESLQKAVALNSTSAKPNPEASAVANNALGEALVKTGKYDDAKAAYDAAAKAMPVQAATYYLNEAISFFQLRGAAPDAQAAAADKAIAADPTKSLAYYLKASALVASATFDAKTSKIILPPGCADAYQKYLELEPTGQFAVEAKGILEQAGQTVKSSYKAGRK